MRYSTAEVAELANLPVARVRALVRAGLVEPERVGRGHAFGFRDLVLLRTAQSLSAQGVPFARVRRSLAALRGRLPQGRPLSALRLVPHGDRVVVDEDGVLWEPDTGQTHLRFEAGAATAVARHPGAEPDAEALYARALAREDAGDGDGAIADYRACVQLGEDAAARVNLGRLLQARGEHAAARACYEAALADAESGAIAWFNLGTLHEECGDAEAAIAAYATAARIGIADAHYNLARLYEQRGDRAAALRHLLRFTRGG